MEEESLVAVRVHSGLQVKQDLLLDLMAWAEQRPVVSDMMKAPYVDAQLKHDREHLASIEKALSAFGEM